MNKELAKIEQTMLGIEDHGILTATLHVNYGGAGQGVGGYDIRNTAGAFISGVLAACGVRSWEEVKGRTIFVLTDETRRVVGIENLPTEPGRQFLFAESQGEPS